MKTTIIRDIGGQISLVVEGESAPEAVANEFIRVEEIIFPKVEKKATTEEKKEVKE